MKKRVVKRMDSGDGGDGVFMVCDYVVCFVSCVNW